MKNKDVDKHQKNFLALKKIPGNSACDLTPFFRPPTSCHRRDKALIFQVNHRRISGPFFFEIRGAGQRVR
uniref:Uncharacterized protein n=1 Tax=viral metagenome TaxID=1070528 RepID=A0A6C0BPG6_9ZZZZ